MRHLSRRFRYHHSETRLKYDSARITMTWPVLFKTWQGALLFSDCSGFAYGITWQPRRVPGGHFQSTQHRRGLRLSSQSQDLRNSMAGSDDDDAEALPMALRPILTRIPTLPQQASRIQGHARYNAVKHLCDLSAHWSL